MASLNLSSRTKKTVDKDVYKEILNKGKIRKKVVGNKGTRLTLLQFTRVENYVFTQKANANL